MNTTEKNKLLNIVFKLNNYREFTEYSPFKLNSLTIEALTIVKHVNKDSTCYADLKKANQIYEEFRFIPSNKMTQQMINNYSMDIIRSLQYSIQEFADSY